MLIVLSGLPGTGKTTIARRVCQTMYATYVRIDAIEQALLSSLPAPREVGALGYVVAYELTAANLALGNPVVVDAVNPLAMVREAWRNIAAKAASGILEVEIVCSDPREHQRRVEARVADIPGHVLPTWDEVQNRTYEPWSGDRLVIDSAQLSAEEAASRVVESARRYSIRR
jgi:predicted kinase